MDISISTIASRFAFPFPTLADDSESGAWSNTVSGRGYAAADSSSLLSRLPPPHPLEEGMDGAHAFIAACGSGLLLSSSSRSGRSGRAGEESAVDLERLASRSWNVELQYKASTATPAACILRPPPLVIDNTVYRGAAVCVLPSGVVRLITYGSVRATQRIAQRIEAELRDAYLPSEVREAAKEERRLLTAVFSGVRDEELMSYVHTTAVAPPQQRGAEAVSLAAALAGDDERGRQRGSQRAVAAKSFTSTGPLVVSADAAAGPSRSGRRHAIHPGGAPSAAEGMPETALKIDFVQSTASPRWDEIAGLREFIFRSEADAELKAQEGVDDAEAVGAVGRSGHYPDNVEREGTPIQSQGAEVGPSPPRVTPKAVHRASVNVRGDAPLLWWRWFLAAKSDTAQPFRKKLKAEEGSDATAGDAQAADAEAKYWRCAGHTDASPSSPAVQRFVRYLEHKRFLVAHHVVSAKVRRNASQSSLQLLLEWRTAPPPSPRMEASLVAPRLPLATPSLSLSVAAATVTADRDAPERASHASATLPVTSSRRTLSLTNAAAGKEAWAVEASAADFFLESTFIAESTLPYGLESTRQSTLFSRDAPPSALASALQEDATVSGGDALLVGAGSAVGDQGGLPREEATGSTQVKQSGGCARPVSSSDTISGAKRRRQAKTSADAAASSVEQVSCLLYSTGRVQLSTGSEASIRQICEVLLIPFLVATAEIALK